ncbi:hypothetical protein [Mammaliicoccus sp. I-M35]|uniref:hypothetical protein n=1 Tax=Mammaliicoccus sp. I-M35 TaxID=2898694 RepID=UPI001EFB1A41|nr:hypothetical protein [Mammaliicoccus sp. I-M35]
MRKTILICLIALCGSTMIYKGINTINAIYFSILISGMLYYLYANLLEIKKPTSQSLATEEVGNHSESYLRNNSLKS